MSCQCALENRIDVSDFCFNLVWCVVSCVVWCVVLCVVDIRGSQHRLDIRFHTVADGGYEIRHSMA